MTTSTSLSECNNYQHGQLTFIELLAFNAESNADQSVFIFTQGDNIRDELCFGRLHKKAQAIAAHLQSLKTFGDRALMLYPPGLDFIVAFFACLYAGLIAVPAYPPRRNQSLSRLQAIVADAQATIVLTTERLQDSLQSRMATELQFTPEHWLATDMVPLTEARAWQRPPVTPDSIALLQYTSGSTGDPKGVMISHGNLMHNSAVIHQGFGHTVDSRGVIWLPQYHDMGLIGGVLQPLYSGFPVMLMAPMDFLQKPIRWLQMLSEFRATTSGGPNFAYELCCQRISTEQLATLDLSCWQVAFTGAEPIRAETLSRFAEKFAACGFRPEAFYPCYGMAESTLMITGGHHSKAPVVLSLDSTALEQHQVVKRQDTSDLAKQLVSCGQSLLGQQIAIVDPDTHLSCAENRVGEIWVSGDSVAQGYWRAELASQAAFQAYFRDSEAGPFLRTGDLGFIADGELFITGRLKDIIIIRGQNHYPQDIELTVEASHPALKAGAGAAFAIEDRASEQLVIVQEVERSYLRQLDSQTVMAAIRQNVVTLHSITPYAVVLVKPGSIPKTSSGKIRRRACRLAFTTNTLTVVDDWCQDPKITCKYADLEVDLESIYQQIKLHKQGNFHAESQ